MTDLGLSSLFEDEKVLWTMEMTQMETQMGMHAATQKATLRAESKTELR